MSRKDYAGQTVKIRTDNEYQLLVDGAKYSVEGYWDDLTGGSWMHANGNPAAMGYAIRGLGLPIDNEVLYGKIGHLGYLVHVSEVDTL